MFTCHQLFNAYKKNCANVEKNQQCDIIKAFMKIQECSMKQRDYYC